MHDDASDPAQLGFDLGEMTRQKGYEPDLTEIREDLAAMLQAARDVTIDTLWDRRTYRYNKVVFPQLTRWLPTEEAQQLCFEFVQQLGRIELLMVA